MGISSPRKASLANRPEEAQGARQEEEEKEEEEERLKHEAEAKAAREEQERLQHEAEAKAARDEQERLRREAEVQVRAKHETGKKKEAVERVEAAIAMTTKIPAHSSTSAMDASRALHHRVVAYFDDTLNFVLQARPAPPISAWSHLSFGKAVLQLND